jgi:cytochrome c6
MTKRNVIISGIALTVLFIGTCGCSPQSGMSGEEIFAQHCAGCHPKGGNTIKPNKTLHKKDLAANNIVNAGDIVSKMRNPGVSMPRFSPNVITNRDARKVADYVLSQFD